MNPEDPRVVLQRLIEERREDYAGLSRLIGRNPSYIQQFIKRGSPRRLDEADRRILARYFGVNEALLGGSAGSFSRDTREAMVRVPRLDVSASAGHGANADGEDGIGHIAFDPQWLRQLCGAGTANLSFIKVRGDSMTPALSDGDDILVDCSDSAERVRDGIYVLRRDDALMVKRLAVHPSSKSVTIKSDNPAYSDWPNCELSTLGVIGRVIWAGRKIS